MMRKVSDRVYALFGGTLKLKSNVNPD
uniref:Uncharacterized protein n=1 Tax=Magnetococcus massalia (strain MO-1) TaxID=451514 RepID=A0A1S7LHB7_MAGMO|nr:protein of unknown function [Candidatus Magnetococcus massalia]